MSQPRSSQPSATGSGDVAVAATPPVVPVRMLFLGEGNFSFTLAMLSKRFRAEGLGRYFGEQLLERLGKPKEVTDIPGESADTDPANAQSAPNPASSSSSSANSANQPLHNDTPSGHLHVIASSYDTESEVTRKYPEFSDMREQFASFRSRDNDILGKNHTTDTGTITKSTVTNSANSTGEDTMTAKDADFRFTRQLRLVGGDDDEEEKVDKKQKKGKKKHEEKSENHESEAEKKQSASDNTKQSRGKSGPTPGPTPYIDLSLDLLHEVDAVKLWTYGWQDTNGGSSSLEESKPSFDYVCWNHPHLGQEDAKLHRFLLHHFFHSARFVMETESKSGANSESEANKNPTSTGKFVLISLLEGQAQRWGLHKVAKKFGFQLESTEFLQEEDFPGFMCKRNKSGRSFKSSQSRVNWVPLKTGVASGTMRSFVYRYRLVGGSVVEVGNANSQDVSGSSDKATQASTSGSLNRWIMLEDEARLKFGSQTLERLFANDDSGEESRKEGGTNAADTTNGTEGRKEAGKTEDKTDAKRVAESAPPDLPFKCELCENKAFRSAQGLKTHIRQVHELKKYEQVDGKLCAKKAAKKAAKEAAKAAGKETAKAAGKGGKTEGNEPVKEAAKDDKPKDDKLADSKPADNKSIHQPSHDTPQPSHLCLICGQSCNFESFSDHLKSLEPVIQVVLKCPFCDREFLDKRALDQHVKQKHSACIEIPDRGKSGESVGESGEGGIKPEDVVLNSKEGES